MMMLLKRYREMVTIGIPVFNCPQNLISKCLDSVLNQTYTDIEVLIVNDCCTDNTMQHVINALQNYQFKDRVRIINHSKNVGIAESRNTILKEAHGKYLFLMDCDDYIDYKTIEVLLNNAEINKAEAVWGSIATHNFVKDEDGVYFQHPNMVFSEKESLGIYAFGDSKKHFPNSVWNILFDLDFIRRNNVHFESYGYCDDYIFTHKILTLLTKVVLLSTTTYYWVVREGSQSHPTERTVMSNKSLNDQFVANTVLKNYCKQLKHKPYYGGYCLRLYKESFFTAHTMVKHRNSFNIPFSNSEIKQAISPIDSILSTINYTHWKENLFFCLLGHLPSSIIPSVLRVLYKHRA
jgi:glycosyltransferase involved in cell wall biosynthesis